VVYLLGCVDVVYFDYFVGVYFDYFDYFVVVVYFAVVVLVFQRIHLVKF
jgi:hypothetical protein